MIIIKDKLSFIKDIQITNDFINEVVTNNGYNSIIIDYYKRLAIEESDITTVKKEFTDKNGVKYFKEIPKEDLDLDDLDISSKVKAIDNCNSIWTLDKYELQKVKDFKRTNLCKDKFCNNCKKVKQASRMSQFVPQLKKLEEEYDLFHVTLTVPNVNGHDYDKLMSTIKTMFDSYRKLNHYLLEIKSIKDISFTKKYGYVGSIRSLEITYKNDSYHPHLHCIFAMRKGLKLSKRFTNTYSNSKKNGKRKFSQFEILIQKIWRLTNEGIKVTKKSIEDLEIGYSCSVDKIEEKHYYEVFKYMTKSNSDDDEDFMTYDNFKVLYYSLKSVRQIQGYGILYNLKEKENYEQLVEEKYNEIIEYLQQKEAPVKVMEAPEDLLKQNDYTIISRKKIFSYLRQL